ncbi:MAG: glycosyltransferase family 4 protein [bacterium]|nr:glycosyltransferase family 4 protein [bacterium]
MNKKIKICMVVYAYYPWDESRVQREAIALAKMGHTVDVICLRKNNEPLTGNENGVTFYRLPMRRHYSKKILVQLTDYCLFVALVFLRLLRKGCNYKIIHFHTPPDMLILAGIIPKLCGKKIILDIHDLQPELYTAKVSKGLIVDLLTISEKLACRFANNVITVTDIWRNRLIKRGVPAQKCDVIMNLPDEKVFYPRPKQKDNFYNIVYHGTLVKRYGIDVIIKSIPIVKTAIPEIKLHIIGDGEELNNLISLASTLGVEDKIYFSKKFVTVDELPDILSKMNTGIVPNRADCFTKEVLNTKLLEYAAMNIPIIASSTIGIRTYFDKDSILFFTPENEKELAEKIIYLYNNPNKVKELAANAEQIFKKHNWRAESQKLRKYCR